MISRFVVVALSVALAAPLAGQTAMSGDTAAVLSAQSIVGEVDVAVAQRVLTRRDTAVTCPPSGREAHGSAYTDALHRVRRLDTEGGGEDHSETLKTYFDTLGRARFVFAQRAAVNGTLQEDRVFYNEGGSPVRRLMHQIHGPGYSFDALPTIPRLETWIQDLCG